MTTNEKFIHDFYMAFQNKDYEKLKTFYGEKAIFNDPVFKNLNQYEVGKMWEMLLKRGTDLSLTFHSIKSDGDKVTATWEPHYTFSQTNKKVKNLIKAEFMIENNQITSHTDWFNFYKWSSQALGLMGKLLGNTSFLKNKISKKANESLLKYIAKYP